jgi:hypothetical protein
VRRGSGFPARLLHRTERWRIALENKDPGGRDEAEEEVDSEVKAAL